MRITLRDCSNPSTHPIHVSDPQRSMYSAEEGRPTRYLCGGGSLGDKRIRAAESLTDLVAELDAETRKLRENSDLIAVLDRWLAERADRPIPANDAGLDCEPDVEYDHDGSMADRLADRYERNVLGL